MRAFSCPVLAAAVRIAASAGDWVSAPRASSLTVVRPRLPPFPQQGDQGGDRIGAPHRGCGAEHLQEGHVILRHPGEVACRIAHP